MNHEQTQDLFSLAFDEQLSAAEQKDFQAHLDTCASCLQAFAGYKTAIEALRAQPVMRMPVAVEISDSLEPKRPFWLQVGEFFTRGRGAATALGIAAAALLLIVATRGVHSPPSATLGTVPGAFSNISNGLTSGNGAANAPQDRSNDLATGGCMPTLLPSNAAAAAATSFSDQVTVKAANGKPAQIVIAAPSASVQAGQNLRIFSRATFTQVSVGAPGSSPGAPYVVGPCISVRVVTSGAGNANAQTAAPAFQAVDTTGNYVAALPPGLKPGDQIQVVATVPAGSDGIAELPALQATLTITVS